MDKRTIRYYIKEVYGKIYYFPIDFPLEIQRLTGKKSVAMIEDKKLDRSIMASLEAMGFNFKEVTRAEAEQLITR